MKGVKARVPFFAACLLFVCSAASTLAQQVIEVRWPTKHASPPVSFAELPNETSAMIRFGLAALSEETIVTSALLQGQSLGLTAADAGKLRELFSSYYQRVRQTPAYKDAPSALFYCYSEQKPAEGLATVYVPAKLTTGTKTILFLHGYGGSLLAYAHFLSTTFPNHIIIVPAYGISPAKVPLAYLTEAQKAVARRLKVPESKPLLMGLSAGGFGACRVYVSQPAAFSRVICLGAYVPEDTLPQLNRNMELRFVAGAAEPYVANGSFQKQMLSIQNRVKRLEWKTIPGANHYFLLSHEQQTKKIVLDFAK